MRVSDNLQLSDTRETRKRQRQKLRCSPSPPSRLGAVPWTSENQFAPSDIETDVAQARHKYGLGYHDLYFKHDVPKHLQKQVDALPIRIMAARDRMNEVRHIVEDYVYELADQSISEARRKLVFSDLKKKIIEHDTKAEADEADANESGDLDDDESWRETEAEECAARDDFQRQMGVDEDGDAYRGR